MSAPLVLRWEGDGVFRALGRTARECEAQRVVGQIYRVAEVEERSAASHRHYFVSIAEAWANLPHEYDGRWQSPEALRKFCLIKTGFATQTQYVAASKAEAQRMAAFIPTVSDEYVLATVQGAVVTVWRAESQSYKAMGRKRFLDSKDAVLGLLAQMLRVPANDLKSNAGQAA